MRKFFNDRDRSWDLWFVYLAAVFAVCILATCMCGCTTAKYVPVEHTEIVQRTDTVRLTSLRVDTVLNSDTVRIETRGDTVFSTVTRWRWRVRDRRDTVYRAVEFHDSVAVPQPYPVERELTGWERAKIGFGGMAMAALAAGAILLLSLIAYRTIRNR